MSKGDFFTHVEHAVSLRSRKTTTECKGGVFQRLSLSLAYKRDPNSRHPALPQSRAHPAPAQPGSRVAGQLVREAVRALGRKQQVWCGSWAWEGRLATASEGQEDAFLLHSKLWRWLFGRSLSRQDCSQLRWVPGCVQSRTLRACSVPFAITSHTV